ncbi:MAG: SynChlorMet cassette protein ScmC [Methanothrix sp.]
MAPNNCYGIKFIDDRNWQLIASPDAEEWLDRFAKIMGLDGSVFQSSSKMYFFKDHSAFGASMKNLERSTYRKSGSDFEHMRIGLVGFWDDKNSSNVLCEIYSRDDLTDIVAMSISVYPIYKSGLCNGSMPFHAALLERNGRGFLIAASSCVGKSTCCKRVPYPWHPLCDDEVFVVRDKAGSYHAHPFPTWSEYMVHNSDLTWNVQYHVPLAGIFFLVQSDEDKVEPLAQGKAAINIYNASFEVWTKLGMSQRTEIRRSIFENACNITKVVPSFILKARRDGRFWELMEDAIGGI